MKSLILLLGLALYVSGDGYSLRGGFKAKRKYVYRYEGIIKPAKLLDVRHQWVQLHIDAIVELHIIDAIVAVLKIRHHTLKEVYSDPKYIEKPQCIKSYWSKELETHMQKPVKFEYSNGLVKNVFTEPSEPVLCANMKKAILNLLHVDIKGKDEQTKLNYAFTKQEVSVLGKCPTTYSVEDYAVYSVIQGRKKQKIGMNITKTVDYMKCAEQKLQIFNKVAQGPLEMPQKIPLKTSATIKYNILGHEEKFKIEEVHAKGLYVLYPFHKKQGGIVSVTEQRLRLMTEGISGLKPADYASATKKCKLIMTIPPLEKPEMMPPLSAQDKTNLVQLVFKFAKRIVKLLPAEAQTPHPKTKIIPEITDKLLKIVNIIRVCDKATHEMIYQKCSTEPLVKKWILYAYSLCNSEPCTEFMKEKLATLPEEHIINYLQAVSFNGKPTQRIVKLMKRYTPLAKLLARWQDRAGRTTELETMLKTIHPYQQQISVK